MSSSSLWQIYTRDFCYQSDNHEAFTQCAGRQVSYIITHHILGGSATMSTLAPVKEVFLAVIPQDTTDGLKVSIWNYELYYSTMSAQHILPRKLCTNCSVYQTFFFSPWRDQSVPCIKKRTEIIVFLHTKSRNHQNNAMLVLSFLMPQILTSGVWDASESWIEILPLPATPLTQAADWLRPVGISIVSQGSSSPLIIHTSYEFCPAFLCCLSPETSPSGAHSGQQWQSLHMVEKTNVDCSS